MDSHYVGASSVSGGSPLSAQREGTSIAVAQFLELIRGKRVVQASVSRGVVRVQCQEAYCLGCMNIHFMDVATTVLNQIVWFRCRFCGREGGPNGRS